jgi:hypothetical protein
MASETSVFSDFWPEFMSRDDRVQCFDDTKQNENIFKRKKPVQTVTAGELTHLRIAYS